MGNTATNVSTGKPNISGGVYTAPIGTPVPTDATSPLDEAFICLGYVSEDGLSNNNELSVEAIKAWGGNIVYRSLTEMNDEFGLALIETENVDVLSTVYGEDHVTVDAAGNVSVDVVGEDPIERIYVFELMLRGGRAKRIVIPDGAITSRDEITYNDSDAIAYGITISAYPDENASTHKEYLEKPAHTMKSPVVTSEDESGQMFGVDISDMQEGLTVTGKKITGTLKKLTGSNAITDRWGEGYFMCLKFSGLDAEATSVLVGMDPSQGSGLVEIIDDPDKNGVFKVTDKDQQVFKVVSTDGSSTKTDTYNLAGLTLEA